MNALPSMLSGWREFFFAQKMRNKAYALTALVLLLAAGGTALQNSGPEAPRDTSTMQSSEIDRIGSFATLTQATAGQYKTTIQLNLRSGPGTQYSVLGYGVVGTTVTGTGKTSGIWYEVKMGVKTGWMSSQYLQKAVVPAAAAMAAPEATIPAVQYQTIIQLNLRSGAGTQYSVLGYGVAGTTVTGTGKTSGIWYEVKMGTKTGWMSSEYLRDATGVNTATALQSYAGSKLGNATQLKCLVILWNRESSWNYRAINSTYNSSQPSTATYQAYGIAQAAPGIRMATAGADWQTNPRTQINWGLEYIKGRYGNPCNALDHSYKMGWY